MTLRELEYLIALADHRHFGRAAEVCLVTQPTLSMQIRKLEEHLGAPLIERTPRSVMLTTFGQEAVERARRIMAEVQEMKAAALRSRNPEAGTLRLGIFPTLGPYLLPHAVPRIRERYPDLETLLIEEKSDGLLARLRSGNLDAAILALPVNGDHLKTETLFEEQFLLAVPPSHALAERQSIRLGEISGYDLMLLEEGHCLRDQALEVCRLSGASERASFRATSLETLRQMVGADVGITLLPELATQHPISGNIHLLRFDGSAPSRRIGLCWRSGSAMGHFLKEIAALLRDVSQQLLADTSGRIGV
ncbi:DNA-binding transcriptional regulator OxyR [Rhizobium sp. AC44/96]|uniref:LysR substrate-binding domain-containing protein n=1 Tax=unclassified Rhizobium TaxID=2613769 RepID=UPI00080FAF05|nr:MULTISPECIES: LysR substrate-binding domain-containing protein [unclassified Rhizobium]MDM9620411.1 LysR substrate-binding domain-containing protein [Rhizobium sp. S96]OCJ09101.1 DNA-binding transcriptional regulator OxyR [Rhizobium sp. AC44/96]